MRVCMLLHKSVVHDSRVRREASALADAGHEVTVVELDRRAAGKLDGFSRLSSAPPGWVRRVLPFQLYRGVFLAAFVGRVLRLRPDVVHAHDAAMLLPGLIGARLAGAKLVYDSHELATGVPYREGGWARFVAAIERIAVPRAAAVITVSDGIAERLAHLYGLRDRPAVVRNVTDLTRASAPTGALRRRLGLGDEPIVLHQGAPAPDRGAEQLIRAMAHVPDAHLAFLGSSPFAGFEEQLRDLAMAERVAGRVHFLPSVPLDHLLDWTGDADVGVSLLQDTCDNHRLALPNKLFEYLAAGVPVVVSDLPEISAPVRERGVGRVAPAAAPEAIGTAIRNTLAERADPELAARVTAAGADLTWQHERHRLLDLYDELGTQSRRALVFVRNTVTHDARVLREAETLARGGWEPVVLGVVSTEVSERRGRAGVAPLIRLDPRSPLRRARDRLTRSSPHRARAPGTHAPSRRAEASSRTHRAVRAVHRTLTAADFYRQGVGAVRALRPELVHCNDWNTMWIGVAAKFVWKVPVVYDSHELWADRNGRPEPRPWLVAAESLFVRTADEVVTTSPGYAEELARRYRIRRPTLVRNLPNEPTRDSHSPRGGGPPRIVYAGGLLRGRGLEEAIQALAHLQDAHLTLIGPGHEQYRRELVALAGDLGLSTRLELRGAVAPTEVIAAIAGADVGLCLIQPICRSYELTLPNKLFEYAVAGIPVLASDLPVIAEWVRAWEAGEVVRPDDVPAITAGIERLLEPGRSARCREGALSLASESTWERERELLSQVYARCAPDGGAP